MQRKFGNGVRFWLKNIGKRVRLAAGSLSVQLRGGNAAVQLALLLGGGILAFWIAVFVGGAELFLGALWKNGGSLFSDFFNSLRDVSLGRGVYSERFVIYPPLANALLWLFSRAVPAAYLATPQEAAATWHLYPAAILAVTLFFILSLSLLLLVLKNEPHPPILRTVLALLLLFSYPVLFVLERGNVAVLALAPLLFFTQTYKSERAVLRELGLLMLGTAAALKLYPALFGLVLLRDRRYREAVRAALYALVLFLLPSLFFGGPLFCAGWLIKNTLSYSEYAGRNAIAYMSAVGASEGVAGALLYGAYLMLLLLLVGYALLQKKQWKVWLLTAAVLLSIPSIFSLYNWLMVLPALLCFLREEQNKGLNVLYFFLMSAPFFLFWPRAWQGNGLISLLAAIILLSFAEGGILLWRTRRAP